ncbi:MATE family efflux transporter [Neptuniibacter caesariensis]|uniref:Putative multi antimicrobial extrusion protein MatE/Na+-drivenmultidrug efflux pump n=1 Tax=Neptuniibacter caesariensis TaxID=207954 RepID=A0A7U8C2E2_NEPCE|nr:MATE family efflux transporter [Neptuniibacter caesariensis]EAR59611.1 putative multi antimicrobial extrusion protein MatE/Na+-drivenmultidrug efflux pump [Oceanospirillum sp. MED92] [Neptuniibacter caesariensis]
MSRPDLLQDNIRVTLFKMTVPMMMGIVSLMLFNLADLYFVSRLGTDALAALGFTFPVCFTVISLAIGLGIGMSATLARLLGAGESDEASSLASDNLLAIAIMVALLSIVLQFLIDPVFTLMGAAENLMPVIRSYMQIWLIGSVFLVVNMVCNACMRASGDTKTPALLMAGSSLMNLCLDPLLIFGYGSIPGFGIEGAAAASIIAWSVTTLIALHILYHKKKLLVVQSLDKQRVWGHFRSVMKIGLPAALSNMMTPIAQAVLTYLVARHGPEAVAAFGVGNRIESLSLLVCLALSMTLPPFISQNFGAGNIERVKEAYKQVAGFALVWQMLVFGLLMVVADRIADIFSNIDAVKVLIVLWVFIVPCGFAFQALTFLTASSFNALHQPMRAMRISIMRLFVFSLPLALIGSQLYGLQGMFIGLVVANALVALTAWGTMQRFFKTL